MGTRRAGDAAAWEPGLGWTVRPRQQLGLLVVVCLVATLAGATTAAAQASLVVQGGANKGAVWHLATPTTLNLEFARATTDGRVFGVAIEEVDGSAVLGVAFELPELRLPQEGSTTPPPYATWSTHQQLSLEPGDYRVRLIGDGEGAFSVPVISGAGGAVTATSATPPAKITWRELPTEPTGTTVRNSTPFALVDGGAAIQALAFQTDVQLPSPYWLCIRPDPGTCADAPLSHNNVGTTMTPSAQRVWWRAGWQVLGGVSTPPGDYAGETTWVLAGKTVRFDIVTVVLAPSG